MLKKLMNYLRSLLSRDDICLFIGSTDVLPPPLKKDEELDLARKSSAGDVEARNTLIEHNLRLVVFS